MLFKVEEFLLAEIDKIMLVLGEILKDGQDGEWKLLEIVLTELEFRIIFL